MLLEHEEILKIHAKAVAAGLHNKREQLLFGVHPEYVSDLRFATSPFEQLLSDLNQMNVDEVIRGGVPLARWLRNAAYASSVWPERQSFFRDFADKAELAAKREAAAPLPATQKERVLFVSDMLPFGFLAGAVRTGRSVARLKVARVEDGQARLNAASGTPMRYFGTGWLVGPMHILTNHHVIDARSEGEAPAAAADFARQALGTRIEFDYDAEGAETWECGVAALCLADAALDYALLELDRSPGRPALPVWGRPIDFAQGARLPVNIIQHPGGQLKQIAVRNNLVASLEGNELAYFTDTDGGSSGSPVCNDRWEVLALHKASTMTFGRFEYQGKETAWINVGTTMDKIVDDIKAKDATLWSRLQALMV